MKILGILAHPDDETIFGWPTMQDASADRYLLIVGGNRIGWQGRDTQALMEVCEKQGIKLVECLCKGVEFYRVPPRSDEVTLSNIISDVETAITKAVLTIKPDHVFTHNPIGEYGHGDHRLIFNIVCCHSEVNQLLFTDICQKIDCHLSHSEIPRSVCEGFYRESITKADLDWNWFNTNRRIYNKYGAWSWGHEVVPKAGLYRIDI